MRINYLDLFSGIGGFSEGIRQSGIDFAWHGFSEIDKYAISIYKKHFPEAVELGTITAIDGRKIPKCNLITFGFPCQDLSIAGKRAGLEGKRSGLFFEAVRIIDENKPDYFIFENVKGLLSSNDGKDFEVVLRTIADIGDDGQWQLLNTSWFLPQKRERIYFVGNRKDIKRTNVFPIEPEPYLNEGVIYEEVFSLSKGISEFIQALSKRQKIQEWTDELVSELCGRIQSSIQRSETQTIEKENAEIRSILKGDIQEIEAICTRSSGYDKLGRFCGVVSIPTEEMLLLWHRGNKDTFVFRCIQPEDTSFDHRPNDSGEWLHKGEYGSLLFAVQYDKGRFFYSIGDGRNWANLCIKEVGRWKQALSCILEEQVDQKYFLSEKAIQGIMRTVEGGGASSNLSPTIDRRVGAGCHYSPYVVASRGRGETTSKF